MRRKRYYNTVVLIPRAERDQLLPILAVLQQLRQELSMLRFTAVALRAEARDVQSEQLIEQLEFPLVVMEQPSAVEKTVLPQEHDQNGEMLLPIWMRDVEQQLREVS
jgi:hypothetical protein